MKSNTLNKTGRYFNKIVFKTKKRSPEILMITGTVGIAVSTVMACKATLKIDEILDQSKTDVDKIHNAIEVYDESEYSKEDSVKDLAIVYARTGHNLLKLYGPSLALGTISLGCMYGSHHILKRRNIALGAAYAAVSEGFKQYRNRVAKRFGDEVEKQIKYNVQTKKVEETVVDEDGNETVVVKQVPYIDGSPDPISPYARFFEKYSVDKDGKSCINPNWQTSNEYNLMFLKAQQNYANDKLKAKGYLYLNEVYEMLGLPISKEGQIVGWIYNEDNPIGDNYVDFGLYKSSDNYSDFVYGFDNGILLDFNVDGNIWDLM